MINTHKQNRALSLDSLGSLHGSLIRPQVLPLAMQAVDWLFVSGPVLSGLVQPGPSGVDTAIVCYTISSICNEEENDK